MFEWQAGIRGALARVDFLGAEVGVGWRPALGGQSRFAATVAGGDAQGAASIRVATTGQFLLRPMARTGASPYAGLGLAVVGSERMRGAGYLTGVIGVEAAPGRRRGWFAELGIGGGVWAVAGWRWRHGPLGPPGR